MRLHNATLIRKLAAVIKFPPMRSCLNIRFHKF